MPVGPAHSARRASRRARLTAAFALALGSPWVIADDGLSAELQARLAAVSAGAGEEAFEVCGACHSAERDGEASIGPGLWDIVGRPVGSEQGFDYSDALLAFGGTWTVERLEKLIGNPNALVPGNTMGFYGVRNAGQRAAILAYLLTLRDTNADAREASRPDDAAASAE